MSIGHSLKIMREQYGLTQDDVASMLNVSQQLVSHMETGRRKMQQDIAQTSLQKFDDPVYFLDVIYELSGGYTSPVVRGKNIEWHRLALEEFAIQQAQEAINILNEVSFVKPPGETSDAEYERVKHVIDELLDAEVAISNLKAILAKEYQISLKERFQQRKPYWRAKGWIE